MKTKISLVLLAVLISSCSQQSLKKYSYQQFMMDTIFEITVYSPYTSDKTLSKVNHAFSVLKDVEKNYSSWTPGTLVYRLNHDKQVSLGPEDYFILNQSQEIGALTGGRFDISVLPLMGVWGFRDKKYRIPSEAEIRAADLKVDIAHNLVLTPSNATLLNDAMLDLGGILKGYAVDKAVKDLQDQGISVGIVNAGGNLKAFGSKPDKSPWIIGIRHPRKEGELLATYEIPSDMAIATSGDYERFFFLDGVRYHHIMDPVTGRPVANNVISVSILNESTLMTDALATALFVMGIKDGLAFAEKNKLGVFLIYEKQGKLGTTNSSSWDLNKTHFNK